MSTLRQAFRFFQSGFWWRILLFLLVAGMGFVSLWAGTGFSARVGVPAASLFTKLYYTLGLFVFGGLDLGVPAGGPGWARRLLWVVLFGAPAITTSAMIEVLLRVMRPDAWRLRWMRDHVVIGGCGRLAMVLLERERSQRPQTPVLVMEHRADNPNLQVLRGWRHTVVQTGDVSSEAVLKTLRLERAQKVMLLTGDDNVNLDAALRIQALCAPDPPEIWAHVSDIRLLRLLEQGNDLDPIKIFNSYRTAARHLVQQTLLARPEDAAGLADTVVIAGFGRFGQTVLYQLQHEAAGRFRKVIIIDLEAERLLRVFDEEMGIAGESRSLEADLRDPETWRRVSEMIGEGAPPPVFILVAGGDKVNIRTALSLAAKYPEAKIAARCFYTSLFTERITRQHRIQIFSTGNLLRSCGHQELLADDLPRRRPRSG